MAEIEHYLRILGNTDLYIIVGDINIDILNKITLPQNYLTILSSLGFES